MSNKITDAFAKLKQAVQDFKKAEPVELTVQFALADGTSVQATAPQGAEAITAPVVDAVVEKITDTGNVPLENGKYETETGDQIDVADGKITAVVTKDQLAAAAAGTDNAPTVEDQLKEVAKRLAEVEAKMSATVVELSAAKGREAEIAKREKELADKEGKLDKLVLLAEEALAAIDAAPAATTTQPDRSSEVVMSAAEKALLLGQKFEQAAKRKTVKSKN